MFASKVTWRSRKGLFRKNQASHRDGDPETGNAAYIIRRQSLAPYTCYVRRCPN